MGNILAKKKLNPLKEQVFQIQYLSGMKQVKSRTMLFRVTGNNLGKVLRRFDESKKYVLLNA